jgi:hypothetical protein
MKRILLGLLAASSALVGAPALAQTYQVASGCMIPPAMIAGPSFYVNPSASTGGTGTQASPFNSLPAAVAATNGNGGTINLMAGSYGAVSFANEANTNWLRVAAVPGQTPNFSTLAINHTNELIVDGVQVSGPATGQFQVLVGVQDGGAAAPTSNIVLANMAVNSGDTTAQVDALTQAQMAAQMHYAGFYIVGTADTSGVNVGKNGEPYTNCISASNNHVSDVLTGAYLYANSVLFTGNEIDHFADNGIMYGGDNQTITKDTVEDAINIGDGGGLGGSAAIQGWLGVVPAGADFNAFSNVLVDSDQVYRQLDKANPFPDATLQGIVAGNIYSDWTNETVTNNVIVTTGCNGIILAAIHNSLVAFNTIGEESSVQNGNCYGGGNTAILVGGGNGQVAGGSSSSTRIFGNLAPDIQNTSGATIDHNAGICDYDTDIFCIPIQELGARKNSGDQTTFNDAPDGTAQSCENCNFNNFSSFLISTQTLTVPSYNLALAPTSWVLTSFSAPPAGVGPQTDILGNPRFGNGTTVCTIPVPGAYAYAVPCPAGN